MKKIIAISLCTILTLSFATYLDKTLIKNKPKDQIADQSEKNNVEIPNPFENCKTIADAEKITGFSINEPASIPFGYSLETIRAAKNGMVEIIYVNKENTIHFRQAKGNKDISGDYNNYEENKTISVSNMQVIIKGNDGKVNVATWVNQEFSFAITSNGLDSNSIINMINSIK